MSTSTAARQWDGNGIKAPRQQFRNKLAGNLLFFFIDEDSTVLIYLYGAMAAAILLGTVIFITLGPTVLKPIADVKKIAAESFAKLAKM